VKKSQLIAALALLSSPALAATPPEGVEFQPRRGFFTETDIGVFFTLAGRMSIRTRRRTCSSGSGTT
jgi:hypothetical protein